MLEQWIFALSVLDSDSKSIFFEITSSEKVAYFYCTFAFVETFIVQGKSKGGFNKEVLRTVGLVGGQPGRTT